MTPADASVIGQVTDVRGIRPTYTGAVLRRTRLVICPVMLARDDMVDLADRSRVRGPRLVAGHYTNIEIGTELGVATKTASAHLEHILAKLGASRRAEIATWASQVQTRSPSSPSLQPVGSATRG